MVAPALHYSAFNGHIQNTTALCGATRQGSVIAAMQAADIVRAAKGVIPYYWRLQPCCGRCCATAVWWHAQAPWERVAAAPCILGAGNAHCRCPCIGGTIRQQGRKLW